MKMITVLETDMDTGKTKSWSLPAFSIFTTLMGAILSLYGKAVIVDEGKDAPVDLQPKAKWQEYKGCRDKPPEGA